MKYLLKTIGILGVLGASLMVARFTCGFCGSQENYFDDFRLGRQARSYFQEDPMKNQAVITDTEKHSRQIQEPKKEIAASQVNEIARKYYENLAKMDDADYPSEPTIFKTF